MIIITGVYQTDHIQLISLFTPGSSAFHVRRESHPECFRATDLSTLNSQVQYRIYISSVESGLIEFKSQNEAQMRPETFSESRVSFTYSRESNGRSSNSLPLRLLKGITSRASAALVAHIYDSVDRDQLRLHLSYINVTHSSAIKSTLASLPTTSRARPSPSRKQ